MGPLARSRDPRGFQAERAAFWKAGRHFLAKVMARPRVSRRAVRCSRAAVPSCGLAVLCLPESRRGSRTRQPHVPASALRRSLTLDQEEVLEGPCRASSLVCGMVHTERRGLKRAGAGFRVRQGVNPALPLPSWEPFLRRLCSSEPQLPHLQNGAVVLTRQGLWRIGPDPGSKVPACTKANRGCEVRLGGPGQDLYLKTVPEIEKQKTFKKYKTQGN